MGLILNFLLKSASKVAVKVTEKAAKKAGDGIIKTAAKKAAVKAGTHVASSAIKAGVLHAQVTAPVRYYKRSLKNTTQHEEPPKRESSTTQPKKNVSSTSGREVERLVSATQKLLARLANERFKLFDIVRRYCAYLNNAVDLPESIEFDRNYSILILKTTEFKSYLEEIDEMKLNKTIHSFSVALFGFKKEAIQENDNIDLSDIYTGVQSPSDIRSMKNIYNKLASYLQNLTSKTAICVQRYGDYINSLRRLFGRQKKYLAVKKYVDSSYVRTFSILDFVNCELFTDEGLNEQTINSELRRKVI